MKTIYIWKAEDKKFLMVHKAEMSFAEALQWLFDNERVAFTEKRFSINVGDFPPTPLEELIVGGSK
jgi:hypothetical protein